MSQGKSNLALPSLDPIIKIPPCPINSIQPNKNDKRPRSVTKHWSNYDSIKATAIAQELLQTKTIYSLGKIPESLKADIYILFI